MKYFQRVYPVEFEIHASGCKSLTGGGLTEKPKGLNVRLSEIQYGSLS